MAGGTKHDLRSAATRDRLVAAARVLFAERGYAGVGTEEIVAAAGVTRGALYHQFRDKADLFTSVVHAVEARVIQQVTEEVGHHAEDPVAGLLGGARVFLTVCAEPEVERIVLRDAPAVLGAVAWRELSNRYSLGLIQQTLRSAMETGAITPQPPAPLAHVLMGALDEASRYVATADDPGTARQEWLHALAQIVNGLRSVPTPEPGGGTRTAAPRPGTG